MKRRFMAIAVLLLGAGVTVLSGAKLFEMQQVYREGDDVYENLRIASRSEALGSDIGNVSLREPSGECCAFSVCPGSDIGSCLGSDMSQSVVDFEVLKAINEDTAAWLYSPGTVIDYPVMKAEDYSYYLSRLPDGTENSNGSLFIDYNCAPDFSDPLTVIYGHNMKSKKMFGSLSEYKKQEYFDEHSYMYLCTPQGDYRIELMYGCVIGAGQWREQEFMHAENLPALLAYAAEKTTFISEASYEQGDRIVALSTCSYEFNDARYVVIGVLR